MLVTMNNARGNKEYNFYLFISSINNFRITEPLHMLEYMLDMPMIFIDFHNTYALMCTCRHLGACGLPKT